MELSQLRTFATAAEMESFTRAAQILGVTQPAVSQQVASLERQLGVSLFSRRGRRLQLNDHGRQFYHRVREALELLDGASRELRGEPETVGGALRIACCTIPAESFLPEVLAAFRRKYPDVQESMRVSNSRKVSEMIADGRADLGFVVEQPEGVQLHAKAVVCEELYLVAAPTHPFSQNVVAIEDLRSADFVMRASDSGTRHCVERVLQDAGLSPSELNIAMETNSNEAVRRLVVEGVGVAFLSPSCARKDLLEHRLERVLVDGLHARLVIYLVTDPRRVTSPATRAFLQLVA